MSFFLLFPFIYSSLFFSSSFFSFLFSFLPLLIPYVFIGSHKVSYRCPISSPSLRGGRDRLVMVLCVFNFSSWGGGVVVVIVFFPFLFREWIMISPPGMRKGGTRADE